MKVRLSAAALADVEAIRDHIAEDDPQAAERVVARIGDVIHLLRDFPMLGHKGAVPGTFENGRTAPTFIIVYEAGTVRGAEIIVLRIYHGAQDRPSSLGDA